MLKKLFNKPFPIVESIKDRLFFSFGFSLLIYFFLMVYQPFGIDDIKINKPIYISGFFFITLFILLVHTVLFPILFPKLFNPDKWTVGKNILCILWQTFVISILNWFYNSTVGLDFTDEIHNLPYFIFITFAVGFFPTILFVFIGEYYVNEKNSRFAQNISQNISQNQLENKNLLQNNISQHKITVASENKDENIIL
jgi:Na+/H+-translocating membrane pyrophosphatase